MNWLTASELVALAANNSRRDPVLAEDIELMSVYVFDASSVIVPGVKLPEASITPTKIVEPDGMLEAVLFGSVFV